MVKSMEIPAEDAEEGSAAQEPVCVPYSGICSVLHTISNLYSIDTEVPHHYCGHCDSSSSNPF